MKKKLAIITIIAIAVATAVVACSVSFSCGYRKGLTATSTTTSTTSSDAMAAVDITSRGYGYGWLTVYKGNGEFEHIPNVVDYQPGDPLGLYTAGESSNVVGIYVYLSASAFDEALNFAVLENGEIVRLDSHWLFLPRQGGRFGLSPITDGAQRVFLEPADNYTYTLIIEQDGVEEKIDDVSDAWVAYDTVYWLVGDKAYKLDWEEPDSQPELYCENAYAISHHSDEAEGALVKEGANYSAYGQSDIYSPYGSPFPYVAE